MRRKIVVFVILWLVCGRAALATTNLIVNGAFASTSYAPWQVGGPAPVGVYFGAGYLSMGNADAAQQIVYQTVIFPTNLIGATLSLEYQTVSTDPNGNDSLALYITDTSLNPLLDLGSTSSAATTTNYVYSADNFITYAGSNLISSFAGQTVNVAFAVSTDPTYGGDTSFYITDVALVAGTTADIPANDDFTNAAMIPADGMTNEVTTTYASRENGEPDIAGNKGGHSLWWTWTAPAIGTVTISTAGSDFNTLLGIYTGSALTNLTVVTNSDGAALSSGLASVKFNVTQGTQFQISLDGYNGQSGTAGFTFRFSGDTTLPVVTIKTPSSGADVSNSTVLVQGTASDNVAVAAVYYQLANASGTNAWQLATGTTSWSALVTNLMRGPNTVNVEAYDTSSNVSKVVSRVINYIVSTPLTLMKIGEGTVSGATNQQRLNLGFRYTLTATAASGFKFTDWTGDIPTNSKTLSFIMTSNLSVTANFVDAEKPTLSITAPVASERWSNTVFNVTGKAKDNVGVAAVWYQLNGGAWLNNVNTTNGFTNWNVGVTLAPGANTIKAYAQDAAGNISPTNSVSFIYVLSAPFQVQITGLGTISPNYTNVLLEISNNYAITALAAKGYVFSNWTTSSGAPVTNSPELKFTMASNFVFIANFIPNPYTLAAGTYEGLFYDTNADELTQAGSGFFSAVVKTNGAFTAKFQQGTSSFPIAGQFSLTGGWFTNALKSWNNTALSLQLDLTGGDVLAGGLTNPLWTAELGANLAVFSKTNPAPQAGHYTLILPGSAEFNPALPGGNGFGTVTVDALGNVTFGGTLGDGTKVTQAAIESVNGQWPLYISLDSGHGMLLGWLTFTNEPDRDIDGLLNWFKPSVPATTIYPAGFTNEMEVAGSAYSLPKGARMLDLANGYVLLEDGGLPQSISNQFFLEANNSVTGSNKLHLTLTTSTGLFQGTTTNSLGKTISFSGAVLQKQSNGFGLFLNGSQSGSVYVAPQ